MEKNLKIEVSPTTILELIKMQVNQNKHLFKEKDFYIIKEDNFQSSPNEKPSTDISIFSCEKGTEPVLKENQIILEKFCDTCVEEE